ncbi:hypothetical protein RB3038 [Rhodopirellula baltica SH 1]|uniref:Uncharacterized protein n=1 Tax=Rhodopirellula baltica (strain DSM 10527 / NCIMB 13988 / SH1) TaxID=243090 RepID=Q7UUV7_RHOBA|nr:hypothetical protein RB3038 [Rhodopirellula baltica SH 1]
MKQTESATVEMSYRGGVTGPSSIRSRMFEPVLQLNQVQRRESRNPPKSHSAATRRSARSRWSSIDSPYCNPTH